MVQDERLWYMRDHRTYGSGNKDEVQSVGYTEYGVRGVECKVNGAWCTGEARLLIERGHPTLPRRASARGSRGQGRATGPEDSGCRD